MDYKNILEGTRPFFQGLPLPSPNPPNPGGNSAQSPMSLPLPNSQQTNPLLRMKFEEGLGATLSQMYNTVSPTLRIPASSSSPKTGPSPGAGHGLSPGRERHLNLLGGSCGSIPPSSPANSVLNIPNASASRTNSAPAPNSQHLGSGGRAMGIRRESPLDLSVKTVRQSADSSTNNSSDGTSSQPPGGTNCVVNSTGGTRSLSSSGASTPNPSTGGNSNANSVIAAVANSTTGREREKEAGGRPPSSNPLPSPANSISETAAAHSQSPQYQMAQGHHLFGHYHPPSPALSIPGDPAKMYGHHYMQPTHYRPPHPPTGSHNFQSPVNSGANSSTSAPPPTTTTTNVQQQQPSRPPSVIPPYNPPQPNFGLGAYHHHHQQQQAGHHSYHPHPYASYHIQQPGAGPEQRSHPYYSAHYAQTGHLSQPHVSQSQAANPTGNVNQTTPTSTPSSRSSVVNHNQKNGEARNHEPSAAPPPSQVSAYHSSGNSNVGKGLPPSNPYGHQAPPNGTVGSPYATYPQYYPSHIPLEQSQRAIAPSQSPGTLPPSSGSIQSRQGQYSYQGGVYRNSHVGLSPAASAYPNNHYPPPQLGARSPHTPTQMQPHYYPYLHTGTPRPIPPPMPSNQQLPSGYPYPPHLTGPRPPAPRQPTPQPHPSASSYPPPSIQTPLNVPTPKPAANPPSSNSSKGNGRTGGWKTGEKRKNLLNLLRNSLETRIHEKQEKEKSNHRQTWNFHGKKYHNPLPPPGVSGAFPSGSSSSGGGSILTGIAHQSNSESTGNLNGNGTGAYPGLFGINQRSNFIDGQAASQGALSPNTENSLNRIRTKAEKKQVFPNLLSQIEQENANKHLQSSFPSHQQSQAGEKYKNYNHSTKTSVFDFQDEEEEAKGNLSLSRRSPGHSVSPVASTSSVIPPKRRSGSKKFTSKLSKWIPPVGVPPDKSGSSKTLQMLPHGPVKSEISVVPVPSTSYAPKSEGTSVPAIDNIDEFWATCDSFLDDLSANPTTIKSRRGGLWAKIKSTSKEEKKGKRRRLRRPSAEVDADFQIEEEEDGKSDEEIGEGERDENTDSDSTSADSEVENSKSLTSSEKGASKPGFEDESDLDEKSIKARSESGIKRTPKKRKGSTTRSPRRDRDTTPPKKKSKREGSWEEPKGRRVGKRTLRERRTGSLVGKSVSDMEDGIPSSGESGNESDVSVASFSISSDDSGSMNSDSSSKDSDDDSESSDEGEAGSESDPENEEMSLDSKGSETEVKKKKGKSSSAKGRSKAQRRSTRNARKSAKADHGKERTLRREEKRARQKLRPTRTCAKGKLKNVLAESEEERGSSGEEWIMRGELGKRKREKQRIVYGDGSEFRRPGWEEELIDFKRKLRMPTKLIRVAKPSSLSSAPSGKEKDDSETLPVVFSPAKSTKENKSPTKAPPPDEEEQTMEKEKKKGRSPKKAEKESDNRLDKVEKAKNKDTKGKKNSKKGQFESVSPAGTDSKASPTKITEKSPGKGKGRKGDKRKPGTEENLNGSVHVKEEKVTPLLPTPGPAGVKFNKKMSIKSVFGVDPAPIATEPCQSPIPVKKALRRNKFKSGFDYIRKKKKAVSTPDGSTAPPPQKRTKVSQEKNMTEDDVQNELRGWVLNKGLGETILHRAARLGYPDVAAYTLEHDICSPNCKDNAGYSPLHETCMKGNLEVAKILLFYGANPSQAAPGGIRPLHEACENGHVELVRLLISYGADPLLATYSGQTPIELAEHHPPVKRLLEQHIKDVQGKEEKPWPFLGTGSWADNVHGSGFDVTSDPPLPPNSPEIGDGFEFESSELPLPPIYMLKEDVPYLLLQDLINYLGIPKDRILKSHAGAELVELNSNDFLEDVHCRQLLGVKFRLNLSSDLLVLIKYDDVVKKMLNIETVFIK